VQLRDQHIRDYNETVEEKDRRIKNLIYETRQIDLVPKNDDSHLLELLQEKNVEIEQWKMRLHRYEDEIRQLKDQLKRSDEQLDVKQTCRSFLNKAKLVLLVDSNTRIRRVSKKTSSTQCRIRCDIETERSKRKHVEQRARSSLDRSSRFTRKRFDFWKINYEQLK
jgi:hypothetical protein